MIPVSNWNSCLQGPEGNKVATIACIPIVLQNIINFLVMFAGVICVFLIVYSGYKYIMSEGDPEKVSSARKTLTYAIAGLVFVALSFGILAFIASYTGANQLGGN